MASKIAKWCFNLVKILQIKYKSDLVNSIHFGELESSNKMADPIWCGTTQISGQRS